MTTESIATEIVWTDKLLGRSIDLLGDSRDDFPHVHQILINVELLDLILFYKNRHIYASIEDGVTAKYEDWLEQNIPAADFQIHTFIMDIMSSNEIELPQYFSSLRNPTIIVCLVAFKSREHSMLFKLALS